MAQMASTVAANDLCSRHAEGAVCVSGHGAWDVVEICWPSAAGLELVVCFVQRRIAASASVYASFGLMFIIFASKWGLRAFLAKDAELLCNTCQFASSSGSSD